MSENEDNRSRWLNIRLKPEEFRTIHNHFAKTVFSTMSEYGRHLLLDKKVTVAYRDRSMDDLLEELVLLRRELNAIGNNLNQAVKNINGAHGLADARLWMSLLSVINGRLEPAINEIKEQINKYADLWSQKLRAEKA